jgi:hypothetical protein
VVPTSLSHKRLHEEVVEEVEDEGMDSAEDFPQGATTSDSPFTAASRSLPPNAATSQSANQQQEEGATAAMGVTPTSAAAAAIEKNTAGEEQAEEEASSAGSCAPPGTKTSSGLLVDEYSMSFDGGDLELEGEIDVGGDIEVDASPLTTPRGRMWNLYERCEGGGRGQTHAYGRFACGICRLMAGVWHTQPGRNVGSMLYGAKPPWLPIQAYLLLKYQQLLWH